MCRRISSIISKRPSNRDSTLSLLWIIIHISKKELFLSSQQKHRDCKSLFVSFRPLSLTVEPYRFLWVSLQVQELCDPSHSERSFITALQDLPEGLTATYERIYCKIACRSAHQKALAENIFDCTICAKRPLRFEELKGAIAVDPDDVSWDRRKISAETNEKRFLRVCGNYLVFHKRDGTVRLAHHTVGRFLEQHKKDRPEIDGRIGQICLTYLAFSDFESQVSLVGKRHDILGGQSPKQAGIYRIPNLLGVTNGIFDIILGLYGRTSNWTHPDINYAELSRRYQKKPLAESLSQVSSSGLRHIKLDLACERVQS